jgi:hypothetical protein
MAVVGTLQGARHGQALPAPSAQVSSRKGQITL